MPSCREAPTRSRSSPAALSSPRSTSSAPRARGSPSSSRPSRSIRTTPSAPPTWPPPSRKARTSSPCGGRGRWRPGGAPRPRRAGRPRAELQGSGPVLRLVAPARMALEEPHCEARVGPVVPVAPPLEEKDAGALLRREAGHARIEPPGLAFAAVASPQAADRRLRKVHLTSTIAGVSRGARRPRGTLHRRTRGPQAARRGRGEDGGALLQRKIVSPRRWSGPSRGSDRRPPPPRTRRVPNSVSKMRGPGPPGLRRGSATRGRLPWGSIRGMGVGSPCG